MEKTCTVCVVSAGTHKPAEAVHNIEEPKPNALRLVQEYRKTMPSDVLHLWASDACYKLFLQHERIAELEAQLEAIGAGGVEPLRNVAAAPQECDRSHPHEEMTPMCELRTEIARLANALARAEAQLAAVNKTNTRN